MTRIQVIVPTDMLAMPASKTNVRVKFEREKISDISRIAIRHNKAHGNLQTDVQFVERIGSVSKQVVYM